MKYNSIIFDELQILFFYNRMNINEIILDWYVREGRKLPWRETKDPYLIWISETILQQTRVEQGLPYYQKIIRHYPDVFSLSSAGIDEVLKLWQGLGYYTRARNLHETAITIVQKYRGIFPSRARELIQLKGIGQYTAAAIASIAFGEHIPAIDGNLRRVISRIYAINGNLNERSFSASIHESAEKLFQEAPAGDLNQALMDFGSLICIPAMPDCDNCPVSGFCKAFQRGIVAEIPSPRTRPPKKDRYLLFLIFIFEGKTFLMQRKNKDIWRLLYQFPAFESDKPFTDSQILSYINRYIPDKVAEVKLSPEQSHLLTHRKLLARFAEIRLNVIPRAEEDWFIINLADIEKFAFPRLIDRYMEKHSLE